MVGPPKLEDNGLILGCNHSLNYQIILRNLKIKIFNHVQY